MVAQEIGQGVDCAGVEHGVLADYSMIIVCCHGDAVNREDLEGLSWTVSAVRRSH